MAGIRKVLVTHNDLDGVACAILMRECFPEAEIYCEGYNTVDDRLREILKDFSRGNLYITDISPQDPEIVKNIDSVYKVIGNTVRLFDHHKTAEEKLKGYDWANFDSIFCGASIFYRYLHISIDDERVTKHRNLINLVEDYDLWHHTYPESRKINQLLKAMGRKRFIERALNMENPHEFSATDELLLEIQEESLEIYKKKALVNHILTHDLKGNIVATIFAENWQSEVGHYIIENVDKIDYVAIIDLSGYKVSLRSKKIDVSEIAKGFGGGGHKNAAGFEISKDVFAFNMPPIF